MAIYAPKMWILSLNFNRLAHKKIQEAKIWSVEAPIEFLFIVWYLMKQ